jgi:HSP20 family molecular chaperone IbpA
MILSIMIGILKPPSSSTLPAVNIKDLETQFEISLAAPGMKKSDFEIEIEVRTIVHLLIIRRRAAVRKW